MKNFKSRVMAICRVRLFFVVAAMVALAGTASAGQSWQFIVLGDSRNSGGGNGVNTSILGEMANAIVNENPEFVLFTGDLVYGYTSQSVMESQLTTWRDTMQPVYNANIGVYPIRGNHEAYTASTAKAAWDNVFTGSYALPDNGPSGEENITFSFTHENAFLVGLDHYGPTAGHPSRIDQTWLDGQFASHNPGTQPHVFVFAHEPAFKVDSSGCMDDYPSQRDTFWDSLGDADARVYFAGHDHFFDHAKIPDADGNWIHQMVLGTGGAPLRDWDGEYNGVNSGRTVVGLSHRRAYGYAVVDVNDLDVTITFKERTGANTFAETYSFSYTIPEPTTLAMLGLGLSGIVAFRRRRGR